MKALNVDTEDIGSETPKELRGWGMGKIFSSVKSLRVWPQPTPSWLRHCPHSQP